VHEADSRGTQRIAAIAGQADAGGVRCKETAMTARLSTTMMTVTSRLAMSRGGRVALHLACILAGSDPLVHWHGITRDLRGI
jgi:hypothetical protein